MHVSTAFVIFVASACSSWLWYGSHYWLILCSFQTWLLQFHVLLSSKIAIKSLQYIQNVLVHAVFAASGSSKPDRVLKSLHWLKVQERIEYSVISITYKLLQSFSSRYARSNSYDSAGFSVHSIINQSSIHQRWSLSSNHQFTPVSRSQTALIGMLHLTCGTMYLLPPTLRVPYPSGASSSPSSSPSSGSEPEPVLDILHARFTLILKPSFSQKSAIPCSGSSPGIWSLGVSLAVVVLVSAAD